MINLEKENKKKKAYKKPEVTVEKIDNTHILAGSDPCAKEAFGDNVINWEDEDEEEVY